MKRLLAMALTLALALALCLTPAANAEDELVKGIFTVMTFPGSTYYLEKETMLRYYTGGEYTETFDGDGFTISIRNTSIEEGTYTFVRDGDYLTLSAELYDYTASGLAMHLMRAVGLYYRQNPILVNGYVTAVNTRGLQNKNFKQEPIPSEKYDYGFKYWVNISGPLEMDELDQMVLTGDDLMMFGFMPLDDYDFGMSMAFGKVSVAIFGSKDSSVFLAGEYGGLDDIALQDLREMVKAAQPTGWEAFCDEVTALENTEGSGYTVTLDPGDDAFMSTMTQPAEDYSYVLVRFGSAEE